MSRERRPETPHQAAAEEVELEDFVRMIWRAQKMTIRTHVPARVVSFNPALCTATVTVEVLDVVSVPDATKLPQRVLVPPNPLDGPNAKAVLQPLQLVEIPVWVHATNLGRCTLPIATGDTGTLHVFDRSIAAWRSLGSPTRAYLRFTHMLQDSMFEPGLRPTTSPLVPPVDITAAVLDGPLVKIGDQTLATEHIMKWESWILAFINAVTTAATGSMDGGATFKANLIANLALITTAQAASTKATVE